MNNIFLIKKFSKSPHQLIESLKKITSDDFQIDLANFPVPLSYVVIKKDYYAKVKEDLESFIKILNKIFLNTIKKKDFSRLNLKSQEIGVLENYEIKNYLRPLIRLDCALTKTGPKIFEVNARHPFGPGSFMLGHNFILSNCSERKKYIYFHLEEGVYKQIVDLSGKNIFLALAYQPGKISDLEIQEIGFLNKIFNKLGGNSALVPLGKIKYKNNKFFIDNKKIDVIYRWFELQNISEKFLGQLNKSIHSKNIKMINDFSSLILGNKNLLALISEGYFCNFLSKKEIKLCKKLLPKTLRLDQSNIKLLRKNKNKYLLKEARGTEGRNIIFGKIISQKEWEERLRKLIHKDYIAQEFIELPQINFSYYLQGEVKKEKVYLDFDPYFVDGKITGYIARVSSNYITNYNAGGMLAALLIEK